MTNPGKIQTEQEDLAAAISDDNAALAEAIAEDYAPGAEDPSDYEAEAEESEVE